jgi:signal transduction histidine kinase
MTTDPAQQTAALGDRSAEYWRLAQRIAHAGTRGEGRLAFLGDVSGKLLAFFHVLSIEWWMTDLEHDYRWRMNAEPGAQAVFEILKQPGDSGSAAGHEARLSARVDRLLTCLIGEDRPMAAVHRSFCVQDDGARDRLSAELRRDPVFRDALRFPDQGSILLLELKEDSGFVGLMALSARDNRRFEKGESALYEQLAETICRAVMNRRAQFRLRERIKELTCLHGVAQAVQSHSDSLDSALQAIVELLPAAMQFPLIADARLSIDDRLYTSRAEGVQLHRHAAPIVVGGRRRGELEVSYHDAHPEFAAGVFLREERQLLISVAHEIAMLINRTESDAAKVSLAEQLRHADRLATIGQLAAGVAHELNEPLGNIMGFAQLLQKHEGLPGAAHRDAEQIVQAALHGREVVKKLLLFARQSDAQRVPLDLCALIRESLYFFEARCRKSGIDVRLQLAEQPLFIVAVRTEITQVLVNLAVNAIQAMPSGGVIGVHARAVEHSVLLTVEDTGVGMNEETRGRLFTPFFTTKDVGEGTGLGLSVVLGIVNAHGGEVHVDSEPGRGSRFEIRLPAADVDTHQQSSVR